MNWYRSMNCAIMKDYGLMIIKSPDIRKYIEDYKFNWKYYNKKMYGQIDKIEKTIDIYVWNHDNLGQLIDTIAHEIAHIMVWEHNKEHTHIKMLLKKIIKINLEIDLDLENYGMEDEEAC